MRRIRGWVEETHCPVWELVRHFLRRFFESDLVAEPGQMKAVLIAIVPVIFQWFFLLIAPLRRKYAALAGLATSGPYREAVIADELWLITLMMSVIGLLTAMRWHFLFPDQRDYRALAALPVRPWQIFAAKLIALVAVATALLVAVNFLPSLGFPALSAGRWAAEPRLGARILAHAAASLAACGFIFFASIALQGVLMNLLPPRVFGHVSGYVQGALVAAMVGLGVLSFSIGPPVAAAVLQPGWARLLPPVWFVGFEQSLSGVTDTAMRALADRAITALGAAFALAMLTYLVSYRRHRVLLLEGPGGRHKREHLPDLFAALLARDPRQQAILAFMIQTLARSNPHRTIAMGYGGLGFALLLTGLVGMDRVVPADMVMMANFVYYHVLTLVFLLLAIRQLFSLPVELDANWVFRAAEGEGRVEWLAALDRFVLFWGAVVMFAVPLTFEVRLLGLWTIPEVALCAVLSLLAYEWLFSSWRKLPFTCSHLPGKTPAGMVMAFFGLLGALAGVHATLLAVLHSAPAWCATVFLAATAWIRLRRSRRDRWAELPLEYQDLPEPEVRALELLR